MLRLKVNDVLSRLGVESAQDLTLIKALDRLPSISASGPWIAGGAVRRTFTGEPLDSDFDLFFASKAQLDDYRTQIEKSGAFKISGNDTNETYILPAEGIEFNEYEGDDKNLKKVPEMKIQLIKIAFYDSIEAVLDSFDFTVSQFGYDGTYFVVSDFALWDVARKRLVPHKITFATSSVKRMLKYASQGYVVCAGCISNVLEQVSNKPEIIEKDILYID